MDINEIRLIATDADGVLTNGKIIYDAAGRQTKPFSVKDGMAFNLLRISGLKSVIISGKTTGILTKRMADINVDYVFENVKDKIKILNCFCKRHNIKISQVCYMGDDITDIPVLRQVGFSVAPRDACEDVKKIGRVIVGKKAGEGAFRECVEIVLRGQRKWEKTLKNYLQF